jgi:hypothetical protein
MNREELSALRDVLDALLRCPRPCARVARAMAHAGGRTETRQRPRSSSASDRDDKKSVRNGRLKGRSKSRKFRVSAAAAPGSAAAVCGQSAPRQTALRKSRRAQAARGDAREPRPQRRRPGEGRRRRSIGDRRTVAPARRPRGDRQGRRWAMATCRRRSAPYGGVAKLTATPEPEPLNPRPAAAHPPWIRPLACYERHEDKEFYISRFG